MTEQQQKIFDHIGQIAVSFPGKAIVLIIQDDDGQTAYCANRCPEHAGMILASTLEAVTKQISVHLEKEDIL